jgi:hypothetical protein
VSGYNKRRRVEGTIGRYDQVTGEGLRFRRDKCRTTRVAVVVHIMNCMLKLRGPISVRLA